jgi:hypothetical protein
MQMNRLALADDEELRPQIRILGIGAVISVVLLAVSLGVMLGGFNDPKTPQLPGLSPGQTLIPGLPTTYPSIPAFPTGLPAQFPTSLPTGFPAQLATDLPSLPGGNS